MSVVSARARKGGGGPHRRRPPGGDDGAAGRGRCGRVVKSVVKRAAGSCS